MYKNYFILPHSQYWILLIFIKNWNLEQHWPFQKSNTGRIWNDTGPWKIQDNVAKYFVHLIQCMFLIKLLNIQPNKKTKLYIGNNSKKRYHYWLTKKNISSQNGTNELYQRILVNVCGKKEKMTTNEYESQMESLKILNTIFLIRF